MSGWCFLNVCIMSLTSFMFAAKALQFSALYQNCHGLWCLEIINHCLSWRYTCQLCPLSLICTDCMGKSCRCGWLIGDLCGVGRGPTLHWHHTSLWGDMRKLWKQGSAHSGPRARITNNRINNSTVWPTYKRIWYLILPPREFNSETLTY